MPASLQIHTSNRLPVLLEHLLARLEDPPLAPFENEVIVVQSQGMSRWLTLRLAERQGISMGLWTPFPTSLVDDLAERLLPSDTASTMPSSPAEVESGSRASKLWQLFSLLAPRQVKERDDGLTATYLADDADQLKRFQLAWHLAELFESYQLYRPEMLRRWEHEALPDDPSERWQASLWRRLVDGPEGHLLQRVRRLQECLADPSTTAEWLRSKDIPQRLSVFGASTLPPFFLQLLHRLADFIPVDIYFSSPTYHYWGDVRSPKEVARLSRRIQGGAPRLEEQHFETGNPLLAALGRQGRDFFNLLQDIDDDGSAWHQLDFDLAHAPADGATETEARAATVLAVLTDDILHLVDRGPRGTEPSLALPVDDASLRVHVCHSPMREMEVLRDQLLGLFADPRHDDLRPEDVLVMVPDIDLYSPYIEAVFQAAPGDSVALPISIADRKAAHELPAAAAVLRLLDLIKERLTPTEVFEFLETEAVLRKFGLQTTDLPDLRHWVDDLRIRWAIDGEQRHLEFAVPEESANTWSSGLERILMGYAVGPVDDLVADIAPWTDEGPGDIERLGHLVALLDALFGQLRNLRAPRPLDRWADDLAACLDRLFEAQGDEDERGLHTVRHSLEELRQIEPRLRGDNVSQDDGEDVSLEALKEYLRHRLAEESGMTQFLNGRITFCALKPMRTIPFEVICIAGLDDGSFPRRQPPRSFDLLQRHPRLGDRSLRDDDRYLFLETLLATRRRLLLSYVGFSQKDGTPRAPSVVLSELLEHVDRTFHTDDQRPASAHLVTEHRLHPFHGSYFESSAGELQSYSHDDWQAARALQQPRHDVPSFSPPDDAPDPSAVDGPETSATTEPFLDLEIDALVRFWAHPSRDFCQRVLGLTLWQDPFETEGSEPFEVGSLEGYHLRQEMLQRRLEEGTPAAATERALLRARGDLPLAGLGDAAYAGLRREVEAFLHKLPDHEDVEPPWVEVTGQGWRLSGQLPHLTRGGLLRFRLARLKGADLRRAWIYHLLWHLARPRAEESLRFIPTVTRVLGHDRQVSLRPVTDPGRHLDTLVDGLRRGQEAPLPFFEGASRAFVEQQLAAADPRQGQRRTPMEAALDAWQGSRRPGSSFTGGDRDDPWVALCFRSREPLGEAAFATWARRLWQPLLRAAEDVP